MDYTIIWKDLEEKLATIVTNQERIRGIQEEVGRMNKEVQTLISENRKLIASLPMPLKDVRDAAKRSSQVSITKCNTCQKIEITIKTISTKNRLVPLPSIKQAKKTKGKCSNCLILISGEYSHLKSEQCEDLCERCYARTVRG